MKRIPKVVYGNSINLQGVYSKTPVKMFWYPYLETWYDRGGNFSVELGLHKSKDGCIVTFGSVRRIDVLNWTRGALSTNVLLRNFIEERDTI